MSTTTINDYSSIEIYEALQRVTQGAGLKALKWGDVGLSSEHGQPTVRQLRNRLKAVEGNISRLEKWAGEVRPQGVLLEVARLAYRQHVTYKHVLKGRLEYVSLCLKGGE